MENRKNLNSQYLQSSAERLAGAFANEQCAIGAPCIPTGFKQLDSVLGGGLGKGLHIIGSVSSLGKTTLAMQIADQIAQTGTDVLIFSLVVEEKDIVADSISRHTVKESILSGQGKRYAKTTRELTRAGIRDTFSKDERDKIDSSIREYCKYAKNIYIREGGKQVSIDQITDAVKEHYHCTGNTPVVVVDPIQVLALYGKRATDKQNMDEAVFGLKRISKDFDTPVIAVSNIKRARLDNTVSMDMFGEGDALEYASDVLMGLQLKGAGERGFGVGYAMSRNPREMELVILKNRSEKAGDSLAFKFYPQFSYFEEI